MGLSDRESYLNNLSSDSSVPLTSPALGKNLDEINSAETSAESITESITESVDQSATAPVSTPQAEAEHPNAISLAAFLLESVASLLQESASEFPATLVQTLTQLATFSQLGQVELWLFENSELGFLGDVRYTVCDAAGDTALHFGAQFAATSSWASTHLRQGNAVVLSNGVEDLPAEAIDERNYLALHGAKCVVAIPVLLHGTYMGVLALASTTHSRTWNKAEITALLHFARAVASIAHNWQSAEIRRQSDEKLQLAFDEAGIGIWSWDLLRSERSYANDNLVKIQGNLQSSNEQALEKYMQIVHPDDLVELQALTARCMRGEVSNFHAEHRLCWPDGSVHWVESIGYRVVDSTGKPLIMIGVMQEISARKAVAAQVEQQREELLLQARMLGQVEQLGEIGGWEWDVVKNAYYWTPQTYRIFGLPQESYSPNLTTGLSFYVPSSALILRTALHRSAQFGESFELKLQLVNAHGTTVWARVNGRADVVDGKVTRVYGSIQDVTLRTHTEEQLREAQKMEAIGQLAGGIAHDFNNLLTTVNGMSELSMRFLDRATPSTEVDRVRHYVGEIHRAGNRAAELTRQLLAFSRKQVLHPKILDLRSHVVKTQALIQQILGDQIELILDAPTTLSAVMVDPAQMEHVLANLASNARDAMPNGGKFIVRLANTHIHESTSRPQLGLYPGRYVMLEIEDNGQGMTREVQSRLFDPFFTTKAIGTGTGLGLSTVYGIVRQSGGAIEVSSDVGIGTIFRIFFPQSTPISQHSRTEAGYVRGGTETILLVDDDSWARQRLLETLESKGYRLLVASSGREAITLCESYVGYIHLLVASGEMSEMNGNTLANQTRILRPELRILLILREGEDGASTPQPPSTGYFQLRNPFSKEMLAAKVRSILDDQLSLH